MDRYSGSQPVGLADVLNPTDEQRDSAYFSSNGDTSKHTSTASCNGQSYTSPTSSVYQSPAATDKTPSPIATTTGIPPLMSPTSTGMSVASLVSPTTPSSMDANMLRKLDARQSYDSPSLTGPNGESLSRRESVDSRINQNFGELRLASSPYASNNQSTASLQSLQQQRNPAAGDRLSERLSASRFSNSYQPNQARFAAEPPKQSVTRTAPAITGPAAGSVAHAAEPTKGQAWAFPDEPGQRVGSSGGRPSGESAITLPTSYMDSPRSSLADSRASSQFTADSRLPPGQRRLEDGLPIDYQRLSRASSEFTGASHHHHTLQHKQVGDLRESDSGSTGSGGGTYSRTPELRISHKLAERKRRTEMKDLFEQLRDLMPQERGNKASKWEILSRAIAEHHRQDEYIRTLTEACHRTQEELQFARQESNVLRLENRQLRQDLSAHSQPQNVHHITSHPAPPPPTQAPPPQPQQQMEAYTSDPYSRPLPHRGADMRTELPPLRAMQPQPDSMTGVQYEAPRVNGIHADRF